MGVAADMKVSSATFAKTCSFGSCWDDECRSLLAPPKEDNMKKKPSSSEKYELIDYHSLPNYLKHNEFVLGYYRSDWPLKQTVLSIFSIHNETLNVWTHLIGFFIFLALTVYAAMMVPRDANAPTSQHMLDLMIEADLQELHSEVAVSFPSASNMTGSGRASDELNTSSSTGTLPSSSDWQQLPQPLADYLPERFSQANKTGSSILNGVKADVTDMRAPLLDQPITRWPFFAFLCGAMICLLTSSACHLLSCHSEHTSYVMLRLDYAGISALIVTSFYPLVYYTFICDPFFRNLYISFITVFGIATILISLVPIFETPEFRIIRSLLFCCMGISGLVPIVHKMIVFGHRPEALITTAYEFLMGSFYGFGVLAYATRVPERWMPGKFDLIGHSHQLFHVLVIAGAYTHYLAGLVYLQWRDMEGC